MKIAVFLLVIYTTSVYTVDPIKAPLDIIGYDDLSPEERQHLAYLDAMSKQREKRSGHSLLSILGSGIKSKLGHIAQASAGASGHFSASSSSSGHSDHPPEHHHDIDYDQKSFDFWALNKSILSTLLQAVKAIKGATIALTGKLIKGSGYLVSAKGKLISHGGEAVSNLGKKIATSAVLVPSHGSSHHTSYSEHHQEGYHSEYGPPSHEEVEVAAPSAISAEYGPPPDHYPHKYPPAKYSSYDADKHSFNRFPGGVLLLKKIPKEHHHIEAQESGSVPDFKPLKSPPSSYNSILMNILSSSSHSPKATTPHPHYESGEIYPPVPRKAPVKTKNYPKDLPLEHKSPATNYLQYFKGQSQPKPTMDVKPVKPSDFTTLQSQIMSAESGYSDFNTAPSFQDFQSDNPNFSTDFEALATDFNPQFPTEFSQDSGSFSFLQHPQFQDPRGFGGNPFLPTPLTGPTVHSFPFPSHNRPRIVRTPTRTGPKPSSSFDLVKSLTFKLGPNGPVKL